MPQTEIRATDALANERTYLAYVRTALAFVAFGFVIARFSLFAREISVVAHITVPSSHLSAVFGTIMAASGVLLAIYGGYRYSASMKALADGHTAPMPSSNAYVISFIVAVVGAIVAYELFAS